MKYILKAAGTPTITPFPLLNSFARSTLFPGLPSINPLTLGMASPALTSGRGVAWKSLDRPAPLGEMRSAAAPDKAERAGPRRADDAVIIGERVMVLACLFRR
jgi:hypothetical protein